MISWTKYIPIHKRTEYEELGWRVEDKLRGTSHGEFSLLGVWKGDGDPPLPESERRQ